MVQDWLLPLREEYYAPQEAYLDHLAKLIEAIGRADVVHEVSVDVRHERVVVEVLGEQDRVAGPLAPVAAEVEVPAPLGGDDAEVLALGLRALSRATRHRRQIGRASCRERVSSPV